MHGYLFSPPLASMALSRALLGGLATLGILVAILCLFLVSLILALTLKSRRWTVAAVFSGLLCAGAAALMTAGYLQAKEKGHLDRILAATASSTATAATSSPPPAAPVPVPWKTLVMEEGGCSFRFPSNWQRAPQAQRTLSLMALNGGGDVLMLVRTPKSVFSGSLEAFDEKEMQPIRTSSSDPAAGSGTASTPMTVGGFAALRNIVARQTGGINRVLHITSLDTPEAYYFITASSLKSRAEKAGPELDEIVASFKLGTEPDTADSAPAAKSEPEVIKVPKVPHRASANDGSFSIELPGLWRKTPEEDHLFVSSNREGDSFGVTRFSKIDFPGTLADCDAHAVSAFTKATAGGEAAGLPERVDIGRFSGLKRTLGGNFQGGMRVFHITTLETPDAYYVLTGTTEKIREETDGSILEGMAGTFRLESAPAEK